MKIAIASSGLGHIKRGIETWAEDLAKALFKRQCDVTLFQGGSTSDALPSYVRCLNTPSRFSQKISKEVSTLRKRGGWRYGFGSDYQAEQTHFALKLLSQVRHDYDLVHVQDPWLALLMQKFHQLGLSRPKVILGHGTEESVSTLRRYTYLQHLAPCYLEDWEAQRPKSQMAFAIPNFVNTELFKPGDKEVARRIWGLPQDCLVVLSIAAIKSTHKRVDYLIREFHAFSKTYSQPCVLVVAGAHEAESDALIKLGKELLGDRISFLQNVPREKIPSLYQSADIFAHGALHEMLPIAFLEAIATGLPITCNNTPTLSWIVGDSGKLADLSQEGSLSKQLALLADESIRKKLSSKAQSQAFNIFSEDVVTPQYINIYNKIVAAK
ncbi:glycosyltransferase family 4 protein [Armatimonas rosea]|uniref:Glycosyltransferase involved in cell wall biosynthesis n=1 Tax=Armatimonas rosea TaxID=685828 RepID=A0A7W9W4C0_ARMRO|nr:glycosyltransferase family 4 protein [Armatimonas rosea]MBB6049279.1 glycosyltransferase involved in cell wall biosynthesis [Armatimonas rosea]